VPTAAGVGPRRFLLWPVAVLVFGFSWLLRFNDPGGSFAGLTDDHFFYVARGWQILFGDLPVRDFVDHGAPLYYYVAAGVQALFGRGTFSELTFSTTAIALGAALTFWIAARASGSVLAGLLGALFQILLYPRFYNYPKILAYATAIPVLWWFADRPSARSRAAVAVVTVIWFLFRHDHGFFIAMAMAVLLIFLTSLPWRERLRHALLYGALVMALLVPYLVFIQGNGGVVSYFRQASAWAEKDRNRAPVVWPGLFENPDGISDAARRSAGLGHATAVVRDNIVAWTFYAELFIPFFALVILAVSRDGFRPSWPLARAKLAMVAVLAIVLDAGFLRSPLEARLADPSVPLAILIAWLACALPRLLLSTGSLQPGLQRWAWPVRGAVWAAGVPLACVLWAGISKDFYDRLDSAALTERFGKAFERTERVATQLRSDWELESWVTRDDRPDLINLSLYVNACTKPTDRILVQPYMPQVLALARRAFAGGHADLRPGFFRTDDAQRLTIARLEHQSVPLILLETGDELQNFRKSFPLVTAYIDARYRLAGTRVFDRRFGISLFVRNDIQPHAEWEPLGWPCYGSGRVASS
jgi:hypothetical protein